MYNNSYNPNYISNYNPNTNQQNFNERIDNEIAKLQQMKNNNNQQIPAINQTFQLAPQANLLKIVNNIEDVKKELAIGDTPFINNDYSILWIKNAKGEIRTFNLEEIKPKDEKDMIIEDLKFQIYNLNNKIQEMNLNEQYNDKANDEQYNEQQSKQYIDSIKTKTTSNVSNNRTSKSKSK